MKSFLSTLALAALFRFGVAFRNQEMDNNVMDTRPDGRTSYYCASLKPEDAGSCNYIKDPAMCAQRKEICVWKPYP